ncbi:MAG: pyridoxamine 5'-phosphate oxidase family protein [Eggerthellaceae bacterium]|nr:pyridoxamine 5'-phosphate oxidase family protein [Eggerthellaceae bacterium]
MAIMPPEVQELFANVPNVAFSTATSDGQPNTCVVGMKKIIDDETVYMSDQFFKKTLANLQANPKVAITFWEGNKAYQLHGTATYVNEGELFEAQAAWVNAAFANMGLPITTKGGAFVHVDAVFESAPGGAAGNQLA